MKKILFILSLLLVGCWDKPAYNFEKGDCVDRMNWVQESGELLGNSYTKIVAVTNPPHYIVKQCQLTKDGKSIKLCSEITDKDLYVYRKIKCPL